MGSFYRVDDRSGFPQKAERTLKQWDNLIVDQSLYETRQPQDLVRGVKDKQSVEQPRPLAPNVFVGPIYVQISANAGIGATDIYVESLLGLKVNTTVGIMMDNGILFNALLQSIDAGGQFVAISQPLPYPAASGNLLIDYEVVT